MFIFKAISNILAWLIELIMRILWLDNILLWILEATGANKKQMGEGVYGFLNWLGFYEVDHRTALPVFRRSQFIRVLEAGEGDHWHHLWPHLSLEEVKPEYGYSLRPTFFGHDYDNVPTTIGAGRPVPIRIRLTFGYVFEPLTATLSDAVEKMIELPAADRNSRVQVIARPELERITGALNPIDVRLRQSDQEITEKLKETLAQKIQPMGFKLTKVDIDEVSLPDDLEAQFVAKLELLRQGVRNYGPEELSRMMAAQLGEGFKAGPHLKSEVDMNPLIGAGLKSDPPQVIDQPPSEPPKRRRVG